MESRIFATRTGNYDCVYVWYLEYSINLYPRVCNSLDYSYYMISNIDCTLYLHRRHKRWGQEKKQAPRSRQGLQKKKRKRKMTGCLSVTSVWTQPKTRWSVCAATYSGKCSICLINRAENEKYLTIVVIWVIKLQLAMFASMVRDQTYQTSLSSLQSCYKQG